MTERAGPTRSVAPTIATVGFEADRFEHLFRQGRRVAAGDEDRDHRFVEGVQEREQRADQNCGSQHRQRHPEEGAQRTRPGAHGGAFEVAVEALERGGDDQEGDGYRQHAVCDDHAGVGAHQTQGAQEAVIAERAHDRGHDDRQHHDEVEHALAVEAVAHEAEGGGQRRDQRERHRCERDDEGVGGGLEPRMAREVLRVIAGPITWRRKLERDRLRERHRHDDRHGRDQEDRGERCQ